MASMVSSVGSEVSVPPVSYAGSSAPGERPAVKAVDAAPRKSEHQALDAVVKELNDTARVNNTNLSFSVDKPTGKTDIKVLNAQTHEVIRQIPPEDVVRLSERIKDLLNGALFDETR